MVLSQENLKHKQRTNKDHWNTIEGSEANALSHFT